MEHLGQNERIAVEALLILALGAYNHQTVQPADTVTAAGSASVADSTTSVPVPNEPRLSGPSNNLPSAFSSAATTMAPTTAPAVDIATAGDATVDTTTVGATTVNTAVVDTVTYSTGGDTATTLTTPATEASTSISTAVTTSAAATTAADENEGEELPACAAHLKEWIDIKELWGVEAHEWPKEVLALARLPGQREVSKDRQPFLPEPYKWNVTATVGQCVGELAAEPCGRCAKGTTVLLSDGCVVVPRRLGGAGLKKPQCCFNCRYQWQYLDCTFIKEADAADVAATDAAADATAAAAASAADQVMEAEEEEKEESLFVAP
ncbi:hypothetical protein F4802DRAFT_603461 [Xylaria palmicola]|nr:hypothetical protein F4802DRAFT_603461 [Xylaria palmicola]